MRYLLLALWGVCLVSGGRSVWAQDESGTTGILIEKLLARIEALEKRVAELEGRQSTGTPTPATGDAADVSPVIDLPQPIPELQPSYPDLTLRGFTDLNFSATDDPAARRGFSEGQFVFHVTSALSPKISFFGELALTARSDRFAASVERTIIRLDHSDYLKFSFGRYHTPINWWNTSYHHGLWLQTSIDRPEMVRIGGTFIPVHFVGAQVEGVVPARGLNLSYNLGLGNGRGPTLHDGGDAGDSNSSRAWLANLSVKPARPFGLQAGGSLYRDKITSGDGSAYREWISGAHLVWLRENPEIIAEFANVRHERLPTGESFDNQGLYLQLGYRMPWLNNAFKPYYRYEYIDIDERDPLFSSLPSLRASVLGVRYDLSYFVALKTEFRRFGPPGTDRTNGGFMQISFVF